MGQQYVDIDMSELSGFNLIITHWTLWYLDLIHHAVKIAGWGLHLSTKDLPRYPIIKVTGNIQLSINYCTY